MSETSPTTAFDYSGNGNDGAQNGTLTLGVVGPRPPAEAGFSASKTAYQFDGVTTFIDCGTGPSLSGTTDFTVEAWINTTNGGGRIVQQRSGGAGWIGQYNLSLGGGTVSFDVYNGGWQWNNLATARTVNDGKWHHVAAVRSGTNGAIYIDGSLAANASSVDVKALVPTVITYIGADHAG